LENQYTVELGIQFALKVQSKMEKNGELKEAVAKMAQTVFGKIESNVDSITSQAVHKELDPFSQFIMEVDEQPEPETNPEIENKLLLNSQVFTSLMQLLTTLEVAEATTITETTQLLKKLAALIKLHLTDHHRSQDMVAHLLRMCAHLVETTLRTSARDLERYAGKELLVEYLELVVELMEDRKHKLPESVMKGRSVVKVLHTAGFEAYASMVVMTLFAIASRKEHQLDINLKIDCD
jgi:hypothetical protein